jgi:hypothetical protein
VSTRGAFGAALLAGLLVRVAALPLPGTEDVGTWKIWAYGASHHVTHVYGVGGQPPVRGVVKWLQFETTVDYPPAALYELAIVGKLFGRYDSAFSNSRAFTVAVKLPGLLCNIALTALLAWTVRRFTGDARAARWVTLAWWLNPAVILNGEVLGYLDPLMMLPAVVSLVLLHLGLAESAGLALSLAVLTKPQAVLLVPGFALAAWHSGGVRNVARLAAGGAIGTVVLVLPFALEGALANMWLAFGSFYARRDILSGFAANVWWIVNYLLRGYYQIPRLGFPQAYLVEVRRIMAVSTFEEVGFPNPRPFGSAVVLAIWGWAIWQMRHARDLASHALLCAFLVHAYFVFAVGVHEHHMMLTVPLLALAAGLRPALRPLFYAVSAIVALNMNLFYGIGLGMGWSPPRLMLGIDLTVLLSLANVGVLVWAAARLHRAGFKVQGSGFRVQGSAVNS